MDSTIRIASLKALAAGVMGALVAVAAPAGADQKVVDRKFAHVATFDVMAGNGSGVAEIVDVSRNGKQLAYTDAENGEIGFVWIGDPTNPRGLGTIDVGGDPTSLVIKGRYVLVGVNRSQSFTNPAGSLLVYDRDTRELIADFEMGGQPDSVALSPNERWVAVVVENERDEDFGGGLIPQLPSGGLVIGDVGGDVRDWTFRAADLSPVAATAFAGADLEPEYVDINEENEAVVTFQENNHIAVVDLPTGRTISTFSAGSVELWDVDTAEEDLITLDSDITKRREPDGVAWIDEDSFATANEGDYEDENGEEGGSRGWTIFNQDGTVEFESYESFEHVLVLAGHYNEGRSENKGIEPESVEFGRFRDREYVFVGSERSNAVAVYDVTGGRPVLEQVLPTGIGPEGLKAIPQSRLFVASTETEEADAGIPTMLNIYRLEGARAGYPMIQSGLDDNGLPIPWVALSGLVGDPEEADTLYAVSDSFLAEGFIYTVDVSGGEPAIITDRLQVTGASSSLDLEGIAIGPDGAFWLGSEGNASRPNTVLKVDRGSGGVVLEVTLPEALEANARTNGIEGIAVTGQPGAEVIYVAIQRAWPDAGDEDEVETRIGRYDVRTATWSFVYYPLQPEGEGDWIGLSELTLLPDGTFAVIERDKGWGPTTGFNAELKAVYRVDLANAPFAGVGSELSTIDKELLVDVRPAIAERSIWTAEKLEGFAVAADGQVYVVTDNDGVDDAPGETVFLNLGNIDDLP